MENLWKDVAYSFRGLRRNPAFAMTAVASLALGIGANALIFTFLNALFLAPIPVAEPGRLVKLFSFDRHATELFGLSFPNFEDLREGGEPFSGLAAFRTLPVTLRAGGEPIPLFGEIVTGEYFEVLGLRPAAGRFFLGEEDGAPGLHPVVVLGRGLWQRQFAGDPGVVGRTVQLNGHAFTVIGVAPEDFGGLDLLAEPPALWVPAAMHPQLLAGPPAAAFTRRGNHTFSVVARLRPGVELEEARAGLETLARRLEQEYPRENERLGLAAVPLSRSAIHPERRGTLLRSGLLLATVVGLLLLIAGANVANLLLARALGRSRETAIRISLGVGRARLVRQLLTEGALLGLLGGALGLLLALAGREVLWALRPPFFPESLDLALDGRVLLFTFAVSLAVGLLFGLAPALQTLRVDVASALTRHAGTPREAVLGANLRHALVVAQVALALLVMVGAGLFLRSLGRVGAVDVGFEREKLFVIPLGLAAQGYTPARSHDFQRRAVERVAALPGVRSAATATRFLLVEGGARTSVQVEGRPVRDGDERELAGINQVSPGYFETVGMPLLEGRGFTQADRAGAPPAAVVNQAMARWLWPGEPALGQRFRIGGGEELWEVVGVAADARHESIRDDPEPLAYLPVLQRDAPMVMLHVRTEREPESVVPDVRQALHDLDPDLPLLEARTIGQMWERSLWAPRMGAGLLSFFGALSALLAGIGIYGVVAYTVGQRRREIGIRMALGARRPDVLRLLLRQGLVPVALGVAAGLAAAVATTRAASSLLFGVGALDPASFVAAALALLAIAAIAVFLPARRASGLDPVKALRMD